MYLTSGDLKMIRPDRRLFVRLFINFNVARTLDMLADRKDTTLMTGDIMVNGAKKPSNFRRMTGYVVQVINKCVVVVKCWIRL